MLVRMRKFSTFPNFLRGNTHDFSEVYRYYIKSELERVKLMKIYKDLFTMAINHHDPKIKRLGKAYSNIYISANDPLYCYPEYMDEIVNSNANIEDCRFVKSLLNIQNILL